MYGYISLDEGDKILTGVLQKIELNFGAVNDKDVSSYCYSHFLYQSKLTFKNSDIASLLRCIDFLKKKKKHFSGKLYSMPYVYEIKSSEIRKELIPEEISTLLSQKVDSFSSQTLVNYYIYASKEDSIDYLGGLAVDIYNQVKDELSKRGIVDLPCFNMIKCCDIARYEDLDFSSVLSSERNLFDFNSIKIIPTLDCGLDSEAGPLNDYLKKRDDVIRVFGDRINFNIDYFSFVSYLLSSPAKACYFNLNRFLNILKGVVD